MLTGEVVFMSEPVFRYQPNKAGSDIYHDGTTVMVVTGRDATYAYDDNYAFRFVSIHGLGSVSFAPDHIGGVFGNCRLYGEEWRVPASMCGPLADILQNDEDNLSQLGTLTDIRTADDHVMIVVYWRSSIIHIRLKNA